MPVRKFRSVEEMNTPAREPADPHLAAAIADVWALGDRIFPRRFPPGVYKHRSIEEANAQRERWLAEALTARRR